MRYLIEAGCVIDGLGGEPRENVDILVEGEHIAALGARGSIQSTVDGVVRVHEHVALPGIIDAHVHPCFDPDPGNHISVAGEPMAMHAIRGVNNMRSMLAGGITSIRTLGTAHDLDFSLRDAIRQGIVPGPRIVAAGRGISITGGHGFYISFEADGPDQVRSAVRKAVKNGADVIKLFVTGGVMTPCGIPGTPQLDLEEIEAAVREAGKHGRKLASHAEGRQGVNDALIAGVDSIEHGYFMDNDEGLALLLERGAYLVPTIMAYDLIANGSKLGVPTEAVKNARMALEYNTVGFRNALDAGANIAMGSDAGTAFNDHGRSWRELGFMVANGMEPMQAIVAATRNGADLLGIGDRLGTLQPGKIADIIVVDGDPLSDIAQVGNVMWVIKDGRIYKRDGVFYSDGFSIV